MKIWERILKVNFDKEKWQKLYYKHQQSYQRQRLIAIKNLYEGKAKEEVCSSLDINIKTLRRWLKDFLEGGFKKILAPIERKRDKKLNEQRSRILKYILLKKTPLDYGFDCYIWTLKLLTELLVKKWDVKLSISRVYQILKELNLSHQRVHRDYLNASVAEQKEFVEKLKTDLNDAGEKEVFIWFDEFSIEDRPRPFYGWGEKNTTPTIPSDEKRERKRTNGLVCVDSNTGETHIETSPKGNSFHVALYLLSVILMTQRIGKDKINIILDNSPAHKKK